MVARPSSAPARAIYFSGRRRAAADPWADGRQVRGGGPISKGGQRGPRGSDPRPIRGTTARGATRGTTLGQAAGSPAGQPRGNARGSPRDAPRDNRWSRCRCQGRGETVAEPAAKLLGRACGEPAPPPPGAGPCATDRNRARRPPLHSPHFARGGQRDCHLTAPAVGSATEL